MTLLRGARAGADARPDLLLEVAHGATRASDYDRLAEALRGPFPDDLRAFFFVNTDVGAPDVARRTAELVVQADSRRCVALVRCLVPRTFVDCNRLIDADARAGASGAGGMTPGVHAWVRDPDDLALLLARHRAYQQLVEDACARVCADGGRVVMVHSYAPRSVDVPVDERIVDHLRAAYAPDRLATWPLRASVDLIADTPDGTRLAAPELVERVSARFSSAGYDVAIAGTYALHPGTLGTLLAERHRGRTLCLELRRDLLVREFLPFEEMPADDEKVERVAGLLAGAL
ncbi:MAG: N-formylglutamate amidohydrolase [Planctomycetes bacterium]|nr:N-formylglutamate amidohydrolase [Planctomycetota bacterium]